jgi:hypothetical protein
MKWPAARLAAPAFFKIIRWQNEIQPVAIGDHPEAAFVFFLKNKIVDDGFDIHDNQRPYRIL